MKDFLKSTKKRFSKRMFGDHQTKDWERTLAKWEMINAHLPKQAGSLLDIGCAEGFYMFFAAELGWFAWGVESKRLPAIKYSSYKPDKNKERPGDVFFSAGTIDDENVKRLPKFDVILLLSTYHKMCKLFGIERAYSIFDGLLQACNKALFLETAGRNERYGDNVKIFVKDYDLDSIKAWVEELVARTPGWKVHYIGKTQYGRAERYRFMFLIEKEQPDHG